MMYCFICTCIGTSVCSGCTKIKTGEHTEIAGCKWGAINKKEKNYD